MESFKEAGSECVRIRGRNVTSLVALLLSFIKARGKIFVRSVGTRLQIPILNGVTLTTVLKDLYPDIDFQIEKDVRMPGAVSVPGATTIIMTKKCPNGERAGYTVSISPVMMENMEPDILKLSIEQGVRKLREYCNNFTAKENNPTSRWYR